MKRNPQYYQLWQGKSIIGFKRVIVEYLDSSRDTWQLDPIDHDGEMLLAEPPIGICSLKRPLLKKRKEK